MLRAGVAELADAPDLGSGGHPCRFKSCHPHQQKRNFCLPKVPSLFIQAAGLVYHPDAVVYIISPFGAVSHHAPACIFLRLDDIQHFVLIICNSFGIDDIHAFGMILYDYLIMRNSPPSNMYPKDSAIFRDGIFST